MDIRRLTLDDHVPSYRMAVEAFGAPPEVPDPPSTWPAGREVWGAWDGDRLLARVATLDLESWWHGQRLRTAGVASVAVAPEQRGRGLLRPLFEAALGAAAERGDVLSTLYPTANGIYRSLGYELIGSYDTVELASAELAAVRPPATTTLRRATVEDLPAVRETYAAWAAQQNGPLTRTGPRFAEPDAEVLGEVTAYTLAVEGDRVVGYASWDRGRGYDPTESVIEVWDLVALTADGYRALWRMLGSSGSVVGRVRLRTSGEDPARLVLPTSTWHVVGRHPYMLRVGDPAGALSAARLEVPGLARTEVGLAVAGDRLGSAEGTYRLVLGDGPGRCERTSSGADDGVATFTPQGLALAFAGVQSCGNLRLAGHLTGPDEHDRLLDVVLGGRPVHTRDYF
ncbi:hypothetical protein GCM10023340_35910 [Nocardioides marinquilinus]|uniref:N-acetyltransferase domain-containing protein n=1 Tax=Nocardioides marinquilinus TaxID=1210400 RepID=A0ABP9PY96_9ACTN